MYFFSSKEPTYEFLIPRLGNFDREKNYFYKFFRFSWGIPPIVGCQNIDRFFHTAPAPPSTMLKKKRGIQVQNFDKI